MERLDPRQPWLYDCTGSAIDLWSAIPGDHGLVFSHTPLILPRDRLLLWIWTLMELDGLMAFRRVTNFDSRSE